MRRSKFKRQFYKKIPSLFFTSLLISVGVFVIAIFIREFISTRTFFVSPLARVESSNNSNLENLLSKNNIPFVKIENNTVFLRDQGVVYLDSKKNLASQISSLQLILSRLTIEGKKFKKLDLRFDKPIIEF